MAITLTPAQQAALDKFEEDAQAAADAAQADDSDQLELMRLQAKADLDAQAAIDTHKTALDSATAFIKLMLPERTKPNTGATSPK